MNLKQTVSGWKKVNCLCLIGLVTALNTACSSDGSVDSSDNGDTSALVPAGTVELDIMATMRSFGNLDSFAAALTSAGLDTKLSDETLNFTLFAPEDATFAAYGDISASNEIELGTLLSNHMLDSDVDEATGTSSVNELMFAESGQAVNFSVDTSGVWYVNNVEVSTTDIVASNGTIHIIDEVLTPEVNPEFLWSSFRSAEAVAHEEVPETHFTDVGVDTFMRFFYEKSLGDTASSEAGTGGITGSWQAVTGDVYPYQIWLPDTFEADMPLTLILHTRGEQGDNNTSQIDHSMATTWAASMEEATILIAPQAPSGTAAWSVTDLNSLLHTIIANYDIDPERLYINGHSFGGRGVLNMLASTEHTFAAAALFAPSGSDYELDIEQISHTPQWYVVSEADRIVDDEVVFEFFLEVIEQ